MQINTFNGGLATRLAPNLIRPNTGVEYENIDSSLGILAPVKSKTDASESIGKYAVYYVGNTEWVSSTNYRDYVEYKSKLYWTEPSTYPKKYDGTNTYRLGIVGPTATPSVAVGAAGALTGTYQYVMTFYNSADGTESKPSPLSAEVTVTSEQVDLTNLEVSTDPQVDKRRIYRIGGNLTDYSLVEEITNSGTTYTDNIADTAVDGRILVSTNYEEAPSTLTNLIEAFGVFFGSVGSQLRFTPAGNPNAWPETYYLDFEADITGIGVANNGIVVCTEEKSWIVVGNAAGLFTFYPLSGDQGCISQHTMKRFKNSLVWVSREGICMSSGSSVEVITKDSLGKLSLTVENAVIDNEVYYVQQTNGKILAANAQYGQLTFEQFDLGTTALYKKNSNLYGYVAGALYSLMDSSSSEEFTYLSPEFTEGSISNRKTYDEIYMYSEGAIDVGVYIDGVLRNSFSFTTTDAHELTVPQEYQKGYKIQFAISGTGKVYEIEYKAMPRQSN